MVFDMRKPRADAQVSVNIDIKAGYVIDLTDAPRNPLIAQQAHIDAKPLILNDGVRHEE
jgi:hypothetical protein